MRTKASLRVLYLSAFIDYAGIAIVYPVFAHLFFERELGFFSPEVTETVRGVWLGVLIALYPIMQFFSAPFFGSLSDAKGRKKILLITLSIAAVGYLFAVAGVYFRSIWSLVCYRILVGIGAGNSSILSAMIADLSRPEEKSKHFGRLSMSFGSGFILAPFLGGFLVKRFGMLCPFYIPFFLVILNLFFVLWKIQETRAVSSAKKSGVLSSLTLLRRAAEMKSLRGVFLSLFVFTLGWAFFTEFTPLFLLYQYGFAPSQTGIYYGYAGLFYALMVGFVAPAVVDRVGAEKALPIAQIACGITVALLLMIENSAILWFYMPVIQFFMAFIYPTTSTVISNCTPDDVQGEAMGIYQAVGALGMAICPFLGGVFVGAHPWLIVVIGGGLMLAGGVLLSLCPLRASAPADKMTLIDRG
ncbi:MAG: MFS transporter [Verrucomicrobia bacterium]|nr:MFS transporter [Verrucomicrobiota bacterium]MBS0647257.1 MFS transporter [Verrucomicrobiota bacterium]